jgi:hypothetical protein
MPFVWMPNAGRFHGQKHGGAKKHGKFAAKAAVVGSRQGGLAALVAAAKAQEEKEAAQDEEKLRSLKEKLRSSKMGRAGGKGIDALRAHMSGANETSRIVLDHAKKGHFLAIGKMFGRFVWRHIGSFLSKFFATMRSEHTICSFVYPLEEETSVVTDPQVVQIFWNAFMTEVMITAFLFDAEGDDDEPVSPIRMIILAVFGAGTLVAMAMLNRAIFRWGNRGRRFKRGERELKRAHRRLTKQAVKVDKAAPPKGQNFKFRNGLNRMRSGANRNLLGGESKKEYARQQRSPHQRIRMCLNETQWGLAWFANFFIYFLMCWFSLTYASLWTSVPYWQMKGVSVTEERAKELGREKTDEWLLGLLQGFWFGVGILEPIEVMAIVLLPFLFDNSCVAELRTKAKDLGLI